MTNPNPYLNNLYGRSMSNMEWDGMLAGVLTGTLVEELYRRYPDLVGPLKDEIESLDLRDTKRDANKRV